MTSLDGIPSTCATISCVSDGCCVELSTKYRPSGSRTANAACVSSEKCSCPPTSLTPSKTNAEEARVDAASPRATVRGTPWNDPASIASCTVMSDGSGSYSTATAAAPRRAASAVSPSTHASAWPKNIASAGNSGSSCFTPASLRPGTSSAVSTRTTPGTSYAGRTSSVTRACAEVDGTGHAASTPWVRAATSSV